jgi:hypothetical protein
MVSLHSEPQKPGTEIEKASHEIKRNNEFAACLDFDFFRVCTSQPERLAETQSLRGFGETNQSNQSGSREITFKK